MGRKIPGRKHRGVRHPERQQNNGIKEQINSPPMNPDDQPIPQSLKRLMELKENIKKPHIKREKVKLHNPKPSKYYDKPIPKFQQQQGESDKAFLNRVNIICMQVQKEAAFENKYGVQVKRCAETGEVVGVEKRPKDELLTLIKKVKNEKKQNKIKKKKPTVEDDNSLPKLTKSQKRQFKKKLKKQKKIDAYANEPNFNKFKDSFKFGEIVHEPPTLIKPKKVGISRNVADRPGKKELLLKSFLNDNQSENTLQPLRKTINKVIDRKGKRKDLPNALRRQLDKQQKEIIEVYKSIKSRK